MCALYVGESKDAGPQGHEGGLCKGAINAMCTGTVKGHFLGWRSQWLLRQRGGRVKAGASPQIKAA